MAVAGTLVIKDYLAKTPDKSRETGERKFFTQPIIDRIQEMGRTGRADFDAGRLTVFNPRSDSPPYPLTDMLVLELPSTPQVAADISFRVGEKTYSAPILFGEYSLGATQPEVHRVVGSTASRENFIFGVGEGGVEPSISANPNLMVQVATGLFGVSAQMLRSAAIVSIKMSQSAKTGQGGLLPKEKVTDLIRNIRRMPAGIDILSDASRVFSIEEMRALVETIKEVTGKPVFVKVGASHSIESVAAGAMRSGADGIIIDGLGGGTGAAPAVHRDHIGMATGHAVALANRQRNEIGAQDFRIIAAGRVDTPETAFKLVLLGADAVMLGTASLIALGCKVVNMCHKDCPVALTAVQKLPDGQRKKVLDLEWGQQAATNFFRAFSSWLSQAAGAYGFSRISEATGRSDLLRGVDMPSSLAQALGIRSEQRGHIYPLSIEEPQQYFSKLLEELAEAGKPKIASMGRTTDLNAPYSNLDHLTHEGRTVVGPAYDYHREVIETVVRLPGGMTIGMPIILEGGGEEIRRLARAANTIFVGSEGMADPKHALVPIKAGSILENIYAIRESAGVIMEAEDITKESIGLLRLHSPKTAVYVPIPSDENIREEAVRLARLGASGIIVDGSLSMKEGVPIDVAVSQAHDALGSELDYDSGRILRNGFKIFARTKIRSSRDIYALSCLGADVVISAPQQLVGNPSYDRQLNLLRGLVAEYQMLMGATGLSMMSSVIGNRNILRAEHYLPEKTAALLGVDYIGT